MVILGAGASYDSVDLRLDPSLGPRIDSRPPLAGQLFDPRPTFSLAFDELPDLLPLVNRLRRSVERGDQLEAVLKGIEGEAASYPVRHRQLLAMRSYLQTIIHNCGTTWRNAAHGVTHYDELVDEVERWRVRTGDEVVYVTFNYDLMLEAALQLFYRTSFIELDDYTRSEVSLIKLHGSVDWGRLVVVPADVSRYPSVDQLRVREFLFQEAGRYEPQGYVKTTMGTWTYDEYGVIPALAIPVQDKQLFECPSAHTTYLHSLIATSRGKVVTIGWRGLERHFLGMWKNYNDAFDLLVVSGSRNAGEDTLANISAGGMVDPASGDRYVREIFDGGFGDLIGSGRLRDFLASDESK